MKTLAILCSLLLPAGSPAKEGAAAPEERKKGQATTPLGDVEQEEFLRTALQLPATLVAELHQRGLVRGVSGPGEIGTTGALKHAVVGLGTNVLGDSMPSWDSETTGRSILIARSGMIVQRSALPVRSP